MKNKKNKTEAELFKDYCSEMQVMVIVSAIAIASVLIFNVAFFINWLDIVLAIIIHAIVLFMIFRSISLHSKKLALAASLFFVAEFGLMFLYGIYGFAALYFYSQSPDKGVPHGLVLGAFALWKFLPRSVFFWRYQATLGEEKQDPASET